MAFDWFKRKKKNITTGTEEKKDVPKGLWHQTPSGKIVEHDELKRNNYVSPEFTIAAAFGNVHGVYKPGNVKLTPKILDNSQKYVQEKFGTSEKPVNFVFHGGSGSTLEEIREAISYGVIKMNIDTDLQFAYTEGIRDYMTSNIEYLRTQIGNPEGEEKPNKKFYDPRVWIRKGEETFINRLVKAFEDLNNVNTLG